jgi:putative ABC transport system permease protein
MRLLVQMLVVARLSLLTLPQRKGSSLVIVVSMAFVIGVLLSVLSVTNGLLRASQVAGSPARAIVFSNDAYPGPGGRAEEGSHIDQDALAVLVGAPGVARNPDGKPIIEAESLAGIPPVEGFALL